MNTSLKIKERPPRKSFFRRHWFLFSLLFLALTGAALTAVCCFSPRFAEGLSTTLCSWVRIGLGAVTLVIPFCLAELLVLLLVLYLLLWLILCVVGIVRKAKRKKPSPLLRKLLSAPLAILLLAVILFTFTFAPCYHRFSVSRHLSLETAVTEDRLFETLEYLVNEANRVIPSLTFNAKGQAVLPGDFSHTAKAVNQCYTAFAQNLPFLQTTGFPGKAILLSPYMTYTHISGIYTYFTGESSINTNYPEYLLPFTLAHEYSHQRGIAAENEANFLAFAVCMSSSDPFFRYSGVLNVFASVANKAYALDEERYFSVIEKLSPAVGNEYDAYNQFFKQYENSPAGEFSSAVNDAYLKANGQTQGTVTYSLVTTLMVNYCCDTLIPAQK